MSISVLAGIDVALSLLEAAARISALVRERRDVGQETLSSEDWQTILDLDDVARQRLEAAIHSATADVRPFRDP